MQFHSVSRASSEREISNSDDAIKIIPEVDRRKGSGSEEPLRDRWLLLTTRFSKVASGRAIGFRRRCTTTKIMQYVICIQYHGFFYRIGSSKFHIIIFFQPATCSLQLLNLSSPLFLYCVALIRNYIQLHAVLRKENEIIFESYEEKNMTAG